MSARRIDAKRKQCEFALNIRGTAPHQALHGINGAIRLCQQTPASWFSHDDAAVRIEADYGWTKRAAGRPGDTLGQARLRVNVRDQAVGGSEVDSDDSAH